MRKLALVLGGGACKGYAHIGVLRLLEDNGIIPDLIVGTSMGAIIGGTYACGKDTGHLTNISKRLTRNKLMDFNIFNTLLGTGILGGKKLKKILINELGDINHNQTIIPFVAIATDIYNGKLEILKEGSIVDSVLASSAIPGVFPAVRRNNKLLCDGGLLNNVPSDIAKNLKKDYVVLSIDVIGEYSKQVENAKIKIMGLTINALTLMQTEITRLKGDCSDMRIIVSQPDIGQMSFDENSINKSIKYGEITMEKNIAKLKKMLQS